LYYGPRNVAPFCSTRKVFNDGIPRQVMAATYPTTLRRLPADFWNRRFLPCFLPLASNLLL
jgi:hypothetical protein